MTRYSSEELNTFSKEQLVDMYGDLQTELEKLNRNMESLQEQIRLAAQHRFGRKTEKMDQIEGQLSMFNEVERTADPNAAEPSVEEVITVRRKKQKGKRKEDHFVDVAVGTDGDRQDEFLRGDHPKRLLKSSVVTSSLAAALMNGKYTNALPLYRMEQELQANGVVISRQTMVNWIMALSQKFLQPIWDRLREEALKNDVLQADETTCQVINDDNPSDPEDKKSAAGHKNYMWVYRTGQFNTEHPIVLYDYQRGRSHKYPEKFLEGFQGYLATDALNQYYMLEKSIPGLVNANCWVHARRDFADAVKAQSIPEKRKRTDVYVVT